MKTATARTALNPAEQRRALACAVAAARAAGALMRRNLRGAKRVNESTSHDIKLELDVRCQRLIERTLRREFPVAAVLGEEGVAGAATAPARWVVDPIDGTVNFAYGIPHACVSIAMQTRRLDAAGDYQTVLGVVYDPFQDELWTALRGGPARLNGRVIRVSRRAQLAEAISSVGLSKSAEEIERNLPYFLELARRCRKIRMMGAAALALTYVATGRFDLYIERGVRLWDIAAGGLIVECAGGEFWHELTEIPGVYRMVASNGRLRKFLPPVR